MCSVFEIETIPIKTRELRGIEELTQINISISSRLESILYDKDDEGRKTKVKSVSPIYDENNEITDLLVLFEEETQLGVVFNDINNDEINFYPKEYLDMFKQNNQISVKGIKYKITNVTYDLDCIYLLLLINTEKI